MHSDTIKTFLKVSKPSSILMYLYNTRKLDKEIELLIHTPQDTEHHPEGNAFNHTCMVVDIAAEISAREKLDSFDNAVLRLAALTHDLGKGTHTQLHADGRITSYGHAEAGVPIANNFLVQSKVTKIVIDKVLPLVELHMAWVGFYTPDITSKAVRKVVRKLQPATIKLLAHVVEADMSGRGGKWYRQGLPARMIQMLEVADTLDNKADQYPDPIVTGDLIMKTLMVEPGITLGKIKDAAYQAQLRGEIRNIDDAIIWLLTRVEIR